MKKISLISILSTWLFSSLTPVSYCQTTEEIVKKMIEAQGGKEAFESIKDMTIIGVLEVIQQGLTVQFTEYKKEPNKRRIEMEIMGMFQVQAFDGKIAWQEDYQRGKAEVIPEENAKDIKRQSVGVEWILYPEKYGISLAQKERKRILDKDYYVLEQRYSDGFTFTLYIDPDTYLVYKMVGIEQDQTGGDVEIETYMSNYKSVNGYMMAHIMTNYMKGQEYLKIIFDKVQVNTGLEDSLFEMEK